jgi:hypothetical protein
MEPVHISELCMDFRIIRLASFKRQAIPSIPSPVIHSSFQAICLSATTLLVQFSSLQTQADWSVLLVLQLTVIHHIGNLEAHI